MVPLQIFRQMLFGIMIAVLIVYDDVMSLLKEYCSNIPQTLGEPMNI